MVIWKRLSHERILPFHGVDTTNFQLALVYDWADCGNIIQYLDSNPQVSRTYLVSSPSSNTTDRLLTQDSIPSSTRWHRASGISTLSA